MEKAFTNNILDQSILTKPFRKVSVAALEMRNVVASATANGYRDMSPRPNRNEPWWEGALATWGFLGLIASFAVATVAPVLFVPLIFSTAGAAVAYVARYDNQKKPSFQFAEVSKAFTDATEYLPEGFEKELSRKFALVSTTTFALGEIAAFQERIAQGTETGETLRQLQERGLNTIDKLARDLNFDEGELARHKENFRTGRFQQQNVYRKLFDEEHEKLQEALSNVNRADTFLP